SSCARAPSPRCSWPASWGSCWTISISRRCGSCWRAPRRRAEARPRHRRRARMGDRAPEGGEHGELVLLVDDNPTNLQILYKTLQGNGYRLLVAKNGETALD